MAGLVTIFRVATSALAILAGAILSAVAIAISIDVTLRACCSSAIHGLTDMTEHGIAAATFMAAPWVLMKNAHVAVDLVTMALPTPIRRHVAMVVNLFGAAASAIFFWYVLQALLTAFGRGSMVRGIIVVPEWLTFVAPSLCMLLVAFGFLLRIGQETKTHESAGL